MRTKRESIFHSRRLKHHCNRINIVCYYDYLTSITFLQCRILGKGFIYFFLCSCYSKSQRLVNSRLDTINPFDYLRQVCNYSNKIIFTLVVPINLSGCCRRYVIGAGIIFQLYYTLFVASFTNRLNHLKTTTNSEI